MSLPIFALLGKPKEKEYKLLSPVFQKKLRRFPFNLQKRQIIWYWKKHVLPTKTLKERLDAINNMQPLLIRAFQTDYPDITEPTYALLLGWIEDCTISARLCRCKDFPYWVDFWWWYRINRAFECGVERELEKERKRSKIKNG